MSVAAKQSLMRVLETELGKELTAERLVSVMGRLAVQFSAFEIESVGEKGADSDTEDFLNAFLEAKTIEGRSEKTVERYRYVLGKMFAELNTPIRDITVYHLRSYLMTQKKRGINDSTIEGIRCCLSSFFGWIQREGLMQNNPCANLGSVKRAKKIRLPFSSVEIERLKEACDCNRDKAVICFLLSTGCRISEMCSLDRNQVDYRKMECKVLGKGNKERTVYMDDVTVLMLKRYLTERKDSSSALFVGKGTERLTPSGVRAKLKTISETADVENVHPHRFRRTLATNLINHGMTIQEVARILGHEKIDTTMTYVYVDDVNVKNAYKKYA